MKRTLSLLVSFGLFFAVSTGCSSQSKVGPADADCPTGCWSKDESCELGTTNSACGNEGQWCVACAENESCVAGKCVPHADFLTDDAGVEDAGTPETLDAGAPEEVDAGTPDAGTGFNPLGTLTLAPGFQLTDWKKLDADVAKVAALETEDAAASPKLYGLRLTQKDIVTLGTWASFAAATKVSDAAPAAELSSAQLTGLFAANHETLWVGYKTNSFWSRAFLFSETRAWGSANATQTGFERAIDVFGTHSVTGFGDYFALSSTGVDAQSGKGVYFLLGGGGNFNDQLVATHSGSTPAHIAQAAKYLTIVGVPSTTGERLYACRWKDMQDTFTASINPPYTPVRVETRCVFVHQQKDIEELVPMKTGVVVSAPSATQESVQFVDLSVTCPFEAQVVAATAATALLSGPLPGTEIEFITPYATDILVAVKDADGRRLLRIRAP